MGFDTEYNSTDKIKKKKEKVATIDMYRVITLERDTTYIDTSLTIKKLYSFNYLPHAAARLHRVAITLNQHNIQ